MKIAEQIIRLRTAAGLSQGDLAEKLEVSRQSISKWETGASLPEIDKLVKLAELFQVSLDELVTGKAPEPPAVQEKNLPLRQIIGIMMLALAGLCMVVTVLFGHMFGIHTSVGVAMGIWFALLGVIVLHPDNEELRLRLSTVYGVLALAVVLMTVVLHVGFQSNGVFLGWGLTLVAWTIYAKRRK